MGRIILFLFLYAILFSSCNRDKKYRANARKYGLEFNAIRKKNAIDSLPENWVLTGNEHGINNGSSLRWFHPDKDKLLADSIPFYGMKKIQLGKDYILETNWYYTGRMGVFDGGDKKSDFPQVIEQNIFYNYDGEIIKISYSDFALDNVSCFIYFQHYEELVKAYRLGKYIPLCPDSVWEK